MDRSYAAQRSRMKLLAKIKKASQKGKDVTKNVARAKIQAKFREEKEDIMTREGLIEAIMVEMSCGKNTKKPEFVGYRGGRAIGMKNGKRYDLGSPSERKKKKKSK